MAEPVNITPSLPLGRHYTLCGSDIRTFVLYKKRPRFIRSPAHYADRFPSEGSFEVMFVERKLHRDKRRHKPHSQSQPEKI